MGYNQGNLVLAPFPYRDQPSERLLPAVVLSNDGYNHFGGLVIVGITSHAPRCTWDFAFLDWAAAGLIKPSTVRMLLALISANRILHRIGHLSDRDWTEVHARAKQILA
jgi:mRNA-degrading endonuclease toxin of MazEF toxin-antitoxin module